MIRMLSLFLSHLCLSEVDDNLPYIIKLKLVFSDIWVSVRFLVRFRFRFGYSDIEI